MPVSVVTDTVACLPGEIVDKYRVTVVPLEIIYKGRVYKDGIDMTPSEFYEILKTASALPTTSAPAPQTYLDVYEKLVAQGNEVLIICPSTKLTRCYESAVLAMKMLHEKIPGAPVEVLDSGTAAGAQGFVVMDAADEALRNSKNLADVSRIAKMTMQRVHVLVFLDTIEYLAKGGRVPYILAWFNSLLKIKPVVELMPLGKGVIPVSRARTRQKALQRVIDILKERTRGRKARIMVQHTNAIEEAESLAEEVKSLFNGTDILIQDFTPVMGVHTGPGLVGVAFDIPDGAD